MNQIKTFRNVVLTGVLATSLAGALADEDPTRRVFKPPVTGEVVTDFTDLPEGWLVGLERAKQVARSEGKDLLLNFAATDWIPPSIDLEDRVFSKKAFAEAVQDDFVLVRLDFPRKLHIQSDQLKEQNLQAAAEYEVTSYPTVVFADSKGRPYAATGWQAGLDVETFVGIVRESQAKRKAQDAQFAQAEKLEGKARAAALAKALEPHTSGIILKFYRPEYEEAVTLDPENDGGLRSVVFYEKSLEMRSKLDALAEKDQWEEAIKVLDTFAKEETKTVRERQQIEFFKLNGLLQLGRLDEVVPFLDRIVAMDPESGVGRKAKELKPDLKSRIEKAQKSGQLKKKN